MYLDLHSSTYFLIYLFASFSLSCSLRSTHLDQRHFFDVPHQHLLVLWRGATSCKRHNKHRKNRERRAILPLPEVTWMEVLWSNKTHTQYVHIDRSCISRALLQPHSIAFQHQHHISRVSRPDVAERRNKATTGFGTTITFERPTTKTRYVVWCVLLASQLHRTPPETQSSSGNTTDSFAVAIAKFHSFCSIGFN